jgi:hypothetical protein
VAPTAETIVLDPPEVADSDRVALDITPWVKQDGVNWGDAAMEAFVAPLEVGEVVIDYRLPNREITIPLVPKAVGGTSFAAIRGLVQAKAARWQEEGGWIKREPTTGGTVFCDVTQNGLTLGGGWEQAHQGVDPNAELRISALPEFYENKVSGTAHTSTNGEAIWTETAVGGNLPSRVSLAVKDTSGTASLGVKYAFRCKHYSAAPTAALSYAATSLEPLNGATKTALSGALGGTAVKYSKLPITWQGILGTTLGGTADLTHTGTYHVEARIYIPGNQEQPLLRFVYDVGDLVEPTENDPVTTPGANRGFYTMDLGEVRLDANPSGTHRWVGQVQALARAETVSVGNNIYIDRLRFWPVDEGHGRLSVNSRPVILSPYLVGDGFNLKGTLNGKALAIGSTTWSTSGSTTDFEETGGGVVTREALDKDPGGSGGEPELRKAQVASMTAINEVACRLDFEWAALPEYRPPSEAWPGTKNKHILTQLYAQGGATTLEAFYFYYYTEVGHAAAVLRLKTLGGGEEPEGKEAIKEISVKPGNRYTLWLMCSPVDHRGWITRGGATPGSVPDVAVAGGTATGSVGFAEGCGASGIKRTYDNFYAWAPTPNAAVFPNRTTNLTTTGCFRESTDGKGWSEVVPIGDLPRLPVSGQEQRPVETMVALSAGDFEEAPDTGFHNFTVQRSSNPGMLYVPGS